jgi:two-component system sensor histidine kinase KdpD
MVDNLLSITRIGDDVGRIKKETEAAEEVVGEAVAKFKKQFPDMKVFVSVPDELLMVPWTPCL